MRIAVYILPILAALLAGCGKPKHSETRSYQDEYSRPRLPDSGATRDPHPHVRPEAIVALDSPEAQKKYQDILSHPWVKLQTGLTHVTRAMVDDITSLREGHDELNKYRSQSGLPTTTFEQESDTLVATIEEIQAALAPLHLKFPADRYSVLNIPPAQPNLYHTPLPFEVYKRVEMGETDLAIPYFLDVRVFDLSSLQSGAAKDAAIQSIINWHVNLLQGGDKAYTAFTAGDALVLLGHGDRDRSHYDGSHGFATKDRGVDLAFLTHDNHLFVLEMDAPWKNMEKQKKEFTDIIDRPMIPWTQPISSFRFHAQ